MSNEKPAHAKNNDNSHLTHPASSPLHPPHPPLLTPPPKPTHPTPKPLFLRRKRLYKRKLDHNPRALARLPRHFETIQLSPAMSRTSSIKRHPRVKLSKFQTQSIQRDFRQRVRDRDGGWEAACREGVDGGAGGGEIYYFWGGAGAEEEGDGEGGEEGDGGEVCVQCCSVEFAEGGVVGVVCGRDWGDAGVVDEDCFGSGECQSINRCWKT